MKNKYFKLLNKIINEGKQQFQKKGEIVYLYNQMLNFTEHELIELLNKDYTVPKKLLNSELNLYLKGITKVEEYNEKGIYWWDYCFPNMINTYPTYFKKLPALIKKINKEKRPSKNYLLFIGETGVKTSQLPCLSLMQFQLNTEGLHLTVYQRSADCNLGLPCDLYHAHEIMKMIDAKFASLTFFIGNAHIYTNNIPSTLDLLNGKVERPSFILNT
jgi:thymidylate synthase